MTTETIQTMSRKNSDVVTEVVDALRRGGVDSAPLEASLLVSLATGNSRGYRMHDTSLTDQQREHALALAKKRVSGTPLAYLIGVKEFMSLDIEVDERVIVPRPETEVLVETAERYGMSFQGPVVYIDVGTGSGNIVVSLLARDSRADAVAIDISVDALDVARANARNHGVLNRCRFVCGDMLTSMSGTFHADIIVSNPPYIALSEFDSLPREVRDHEPRIALDGGGDGLEFYRALAASAPEHVKDGGFLVLEVGFKQSDSVAGILSSSGMSVVEIVKDLSGIKRVVAVRKD